MGLEALSVFWSQKSRIINLNLCVCLHDIENDMYILSRSVFMAVQVESVYDHTGSLPRRTCGILSVYADAQRAINRIACCSTVPVYLLCWTISNLLNSSHCKQSCPWMSYDDNRSAVESCNVSVTLTLTDSPLCSTFRCDRLLFSPWGVSSPPSPTRAAQAFTSEGMAPDSRSPGVHWPGKTTWPSSPLDLQGLVAQTLAEIVLWFVLVNLFSGSTQIICVDVNQSLLCAQSYRRVASLILWLIVTGCERVTPVSDFW